MSKFYRGLIGWFIRSDIRDDILGTGYKIILPHEDKNITLLNYVDDFLSRGDTYKVLEI